MIGGTWIQIQFKVPGCLAPALPPRTGGRDGDSPEILSWDSDLGRRVEGGFLW